ncbi:hypothetical protein DUNSADRAFT_2523, partial [Dunaliella salina]
MCTRALLLLFTITLTFASDLGGPNRAPEHEKRIVKAAVQKQFAAQDSYNQLNSRVNALISSKAQSASELVEHEPEQSKESHDSHEGSKSGLLEQKEGAVRSEGERADWSVRAPFMQAADAGSGGVSVLAPFTSVNAGRR